jgi:hypothetical protein
MNPHDDDKDKKNHQTINEFDEEHPIELDDEDEETEYDLDEEEYDEDDSDEEFDEDEESDEESDETARTWTAQLGCCRRGRRTPSEQDQNKETDARFARSGRRIDGTG